MWPQVCVTIGGSDHLIAPRTRTVFIDPWISVGDHFEGVSGGSLVYGEASMGVSSHVDGLASHQGANVFIRQGFDAMGCDADEVGHGWTLVRRVSPTQGTWHPATDNLLGTASYGVQSSNPVCNRSTYVRAPARTPALCANVTRVVTRALST